MESMSWPYVAGFFDGEGHIPIAAAHDRNFHVGMAQHERSRFVLEEIRDFLSAEGICAKIYVNHNTISGDVLRLKITGVENVLRFMESTLPYLRVKYEKAREMIHRCEDYIAEKQDSRLRLESAITAWLNGDSSDKIMATFRVSWMRVRAELQKRGISFIRERNDKQQFSRIIVRT